VEGEVKSYCTVHPEISVNLSKISEICEYQRFIFHRLAKIQNPTFSAHRMHTWSMALPGRREPLYGLQVTSASTPCSSRCRAACGPTGSQARTTITRPARSLPVEGARARYIKR